MQRFVLGLLFLFSLGFAQDPYTATYNEVTYTYDGCWADNDGATRALSNSYTPAGGASIEICLQWCAEYNLPLCAAEYVIR